ncbi:MAG: hypothetical protein SVP52_05635 [Chloroflexota bacterium]|nr:hypothetical protein [Chloroflexota bacterium]
MDNQNEKDKPEKMSNPSDAPEEESKNNDMENDAITHKDKNDDSEKDASNQWVREIQESRGEPDDPVIEELDHLPVKKGDLPDWINTLSQAGQDPQYSDKNTEASQESPNAIHYKSLDDSWDRETPIDESSLEEQKEKSEEDIQPDEGFVEISQLDLESSKNMDAEVSDFTIPVQDEEELPDWLEEMIDEHGDIAPDTDKIVDLVSENDEPTKPVIISREASEDEALAEKQALEISPVTTDLSPEQHEEQVAMEEDEIEEYRELVIFGEDIPGEKKPITEKDISTIEDPIDYQISVEDEESTVLPPEVLPPDLEKSEKHVAYKVNQGEQDVQGVGLPESLKFGKYLLEQGEIGASFEIFQTYIKKSAYLEEIKAWLHEAVMVNDAQSKRFWELLGDIALKQNEPHQALTAYTKAISLLMRK